MLDTAEEGFLAATNENLGMYIDMSTRRSTSFDKDQMARFQQELERGEAHGKPSGVGRKIGIRRTAF